MKRPSVRVSARAIATLACYLALFALALWMRLRDPLSSPIIGAEDPYSHMVIAKELAKQGYVAGPRSLDGPLYPPGLHALLVPLWTLSGFDLYDVARYGPPFLGALGVVGLAAFVQREAGLAPALVGGVLLATMPEAIFRSDLLFPTTLDLALLPAFFLLLSRAVDGSRGALAFLAALGVAVMLAHPWTIMLLAPIGALYALLRSAFPRRGEPRRFLAPLLVVATLAILAASAYAWWRDAAFIGMDHEFASKIGTFLPTAAARFGIAPLALAAGILALAALLPLAAWLRPKLPRAAGSIAGALLLVAALAIVSMLSNRLPTDVDYAHMLGFPAIALAFAGLALAPPRRSRVLDMGLSVVLVTFPFTAIDFFQSSYWPSRTVAYLAPGVALLAAGAVEAALAGLARARLPRVGVRAAGAATLAAVLVLAVPLGAAGYSWYRYDDARQFAVVQDAADIMAKDPRAVVVAGSWQPNLFLRALGDQDRVVWSPHAFHDPAARAQLASQLASEGKHPYLLVDDSTRQALRVPVTAGDPLPGWSGAPPVAACCGDGSALLRL